MTFQDLRLSEPIVRAVAEEGYTNPTSIQTKAIPVAIEGRDVLGCAQTGTGKTAAFALPVLHRLSESPIKRHHGRPAYPRALVLCPTRELATQIHDSFRVYGTHVRVRQCVIFGGVSQSKQERHLANAPDVVVATPGRLLDLINQGFVKLDRVEILVLDEADRMLDMGFINDLRKIIKPMPKERQTMLFSATMPNEIRRLADSILVDPVTVQVNPVASTAKKIRQSVHRIDRSNKPRLLQAMLREPEVGLSLVFTKTKHGADKVVKGLRRAGIPAEAIHGNKSQNARTRALDAFRDGRTAVLVATDIAARGIDVDGITHVFNFDIPMDPETYVHRIGRTARAGASGIAVSFCSYEERNYLRAIERLIGNPIEIHQIDPEIMREKPAQRPAGENQTEPMDHPCVAKSDGPARPSKPRRPRRAGEYSKTSEQQGHTRAVKKKSSRRKSSPKRVRREEIGLPSNSSRSRGGGPKRSGRSRTK